MLTKAESDRLLVEWNDTGADYPQDKCIHQLFSEQVERTPDAVAVVFEEKQLTYGEQNILRGIFMEQASLPVQRVTVFLRNRQGCLFYG